MTEPKNNGDYSVVELRHNRAWIIGLTVVGMASVWVRFAFGKHPFGSAVTLSCVVLLVARFFWWLFASTKSAKIHPDSAGTGKTLKRPGTLGAMIGYFLDP